MHDDAVTPEIELGMDGRGTLLGGAGRALRQPLIREQRCDVLELLRGGNRVKTTGEGRHHFVGSEAFEHGGIGLQGSRKDFRRLVVKQIRTELASDEAFVTRFVEEAKTAVELSHPNIVPVYELGVEQGVYYIAMELCEGLTLSEVLAETGPLGPAEGAYVGAEICRALDNAHRRRRGS